MEKHDNLPKDKATALSIGAKTYFTGKPCKHGHVAPKTAINSTCTECQSFRAKARYASDPSDAKSRAKERYSKKSEEIKAYSREYAMRNKSKTNSRHAARYQSDPAYKSSYLMRRYIRKMMGYINGERKVSQSIKMLPYTPNEFVAHMERMFQSGMTWENHGEWHVDHIVPISHLIANGVTDPAKVNCLSNLRPMWASENLQKGEKIEGLPL